MSVLSPINKSMILIVWDGDVIKLKEWCYLLVSLSKYTWERMYLEMHKNVDYYMWISIEIQSINVWQICTKWIYHQTSWKMLLISVFFVNILKKISAWVSTSTSISWCKPFLGLINECIIFIVWDGDVIRLNK